MTPSVAQRSGLSAKFLVYGFAGMLLLSSLTAGIAAVEVARVEHRMLELADESEHATYLLADTSQELARLRAHLAFGLTEPAAAFPIRAARIARIDATLAADARALATQLSPAMQARWAAVEPEVQRLRQLYAQVGAELDDDDRLSAAELLAQEAFAAARLHDELDALLNAHRLGVQDALRSAHERASLVRRLQAILGGTFLAGMTGIWGAMIVLLFHQRDRINEYTSRLESANADLDSFAGRVAHDLKNALSPIVLGPSMLRLAAENPTRVVEVAERIDRCSWKAIALIDSLLAFSRASRIIEPHEQESLPSAVASVLEDLAPEIARVDATIELGDIPDVMVACSPGLLHIVLANVCGNAVKFLEGQAERRVHISAQREGKMCRIDIDDTGPGIPKEAQRRVFEPFFRVEGSRAAGTGIGLATVRRVVDQRGGRIEVASSEGHGSSFRVWLPLVQDDDGAVAHGVVSRRAGSP